MTWTDNRQRLDTPLISRHLVSVMLLIAVGRTAPAMSVDLRHSVESPAPLGTRVILTANINDARRRKRLVPVQRRPARCNASRHQRLRSGQHSRVGNHRTGGRLQRSG